MRFHSVKPGDSPEFNTGCYRLGTVRRRFYADPATGILTFIGTVLRKMKSKRCSPNHSKIVPGATSRESRLDKRMLGDISE